MGTYESQSRATMSWWVSGSWKVATYRSQSLLALQQPPSDCPNKPTNPSRNKSINKQDLLLQRVDNGLLDLVDLQCHKDENTSASNYNRQIEFHSRLNVSLIRNNVAAQMTTYISNRALRKKGVCGGESRLACKNKKLGENFIARKPRGETPEYSSSLIYKRMHLSGDGHESKAPLISNPVEGGPPFKMKSSLQTNVLSNNMFDTF